ncbi:MAG: protein translocase subunit SecF [Acidobacteriota bacterium]
MSYLIRTRIDFLKSRYVLMSISASVIAAGLIFIAVHGFTYGLDFAGGTLVKVAFREPRSDESIRKALGDAGFKPMIQSLKGRVQETLIRVEGTSEESSAQETQQRDKIVAALQTDADRQAASSGLLDVNTAGRDVIAAKLVEWDPDGLLKAPEGQTPDAAQKAKAEETYRRVAEGLKELETKNLIVASSDLGSVAGMTEAIKGALATKATFGSLAVLEVGYVGPQVGKDLRVKATLAMVFSLLGILAYIWFRFELDFGVGAVAATLHDILITLGLVALLRIEFDLTIVAALLTIVGYSVNDTIVIFDRIRENLRNHRRADFVDICNYSVNQTLSRTILTAMTVVFVLISLMILGGGVTRGFAITLLLGVFIGTYSSIYVASPAVILWRDLAAKRAAKA